MFVRHELRLGIGFAAARAVLHDLVHSGALADASRQAYAEGITGLHRALTPTAEAELPELLDVQVRERPTRATTTALALRWEVWDPASGLFPALDADLTLSTDHPATLLTLAGAYRPPPAFTAARPDRGIVHQAASATTARFVRRLADALSDFDHA